MCTILTTETQIVYIFMLNFLVFKILWNTLASLHQKLQPMDKTHLQKYFSGLGPVSRSQRTVQISILCAKHFLTEAHDQL